MKRPLYISVLFFVVFTSSSFGQINLTISAQVNHVSCKDQGDGAILLYVTGGNQPYSYIWSNGHSGMGLNNLSGGIYSFTVTDAAGETANDTIEIHEPDSLEIYIMESPAPATAVVGGGTPPYAYLWTGPGSFPQTGQTAVGLLDGETYVLKVTDSSSCILADTFKHEGLPFSLAEYELAFLLYPNPVTQNLTITSSSNSSIDIQIFNLEGKLLTEHSFEKNLVSD